MALIIRLAASFMQKNILDTYEKTALKYAEAFINELSKKSIDRILLKDFADNNKYKGTMLDLGCGPGQTTRFLADNGVSNILGTDLSPKMIEVAKKYHPDLKFEVANMLSLPYKDNSFASAVTFYSIVHFTETELEEALKEIFRVLSSDAELLISFHIGKDTIHLDNFLEEKVNVNFYFFKTDFVLELLHKIGFEIIDAIERYPYVNAEYPSKRAYIRAKKN